MLADRPMAFAGLPGERPVLSWTILLVQGSQRPGVAVGTRESRNDVRLAISLHGQWKGLRGEGTELRTGSFRYPLFGDAMYEGQLVNGRRHGKGTQVEASTLASLAPRAIPAPLRFQIPCFSTEI